MLRYATRERFIQEPTSLGDEDAWIRGGAGVKGASNELGQIWGRNQYWSSGPPHTIFTPIADIFDDNYEKCRQQNTVKSSSVPRRLGSGICPLRRLPDLHALL
ncbi:hypothetical protein MCOR09_005724 [Pyricularia oryzae]|nr:hypothetical protein MCOR09_005724 [Pyricularia oryzae]